MMATAGMELQLLVSLLVAGPVVALAATYVFHAALDREGDGRWGFRERTFVATLLGFWALTLFMGASRASSALAATMVQAQNLMFPVFLVVGLSATYLFGYLFGGEDEVSGLRRGVMLLGAFLAFAAVGLAFGSAGLGVLLVLVFMAAVLVGIWSPTPDYLLDEDEEEER